MRLAINYYLLIKIINIYTLLLNYFKVFGTDIIFLIPMFIMGIVCAVREANLNDPNFINKYDVNVGAFGAASVFPYCIFF